MIRPPRRAPIVDGIARNVANRDFRRQVGEHFTEATRRKVHATPHKALLKDLLWILERTADTEELLHGGNAPLIKRLLTELRSGELLALLAEDSPLPGGFCRWCGGRLENQKLGRGRPREYCTGACRQKAYRHRTRGDRSRSPRTWWLAEMLRGEVEEMKRTDAKKVRTQIVHMGPAGIRHHPNKLSAVRVLIELLREKAESAQGSQSVEESR
ncbi:hypothetical protein ACGFQG_32095 [Nocardia fluminea]|uniref:hypothetical protein n=1 Tax=Nocardia fluminea TaxID=134984 RepID=UPI003716FDBC